MTSTLAANRAEGHEPHMSTGMLVPGARVLFGSPPCGSTGGCCGSGGASPSAGRSDSPIWTVGGGFVLVSLPASRIRF